MKREELPRDFEEYMELVRSGMFWEFFPDCTGNYDEDVLGKPPEEMFGEI